jgi:hypothetical protein
MSDFINRIYDFNKDNNLIEKGYSDFLESSFQIEEALEGFELESILPILENSHPNYSQSPHYGVATAKDVSRAIVNHCLEPVNGKIVSPIKDVDRLDKACDAIVFAVGSMAKLGLTPTEIHQALNIVMDANDAKTGCPKDAAGKLMKPDNFPNPEPRLQALLDKTSK